MLYNLLLLFTLYIQHSTALYHEPSTVLIASGPISVTLLKSSTLAYQLVQPNVNITLISTTDDNAKSLTQTNQVDVRLYIGASTSSDVISYPDTQMYPLLSAGVAPTSKYVHTTMVYSCNNYLY